VSGPRTLEHVVRRDGPSPTVTGTCSAPRSPVETDYTARAGVRATRGLLAGPCPPTAVIYDNDVMAAASVAALTGDGVRIPADLAVLPGTDSRCASWCTRR